MGTEPAPLPVTSSIEPQWPTEAWDCYRDAIYALRRAEARFVVGGAFAVHKHTGIWRTTKDLDLLLTPAEMPLALATLREAGFDTHVADPVWLAKAHRGEYFVDLITGIGNASLSVDSTWIERAVSEQVLGIPCMVMAPEELIVSKMFVAYRERFDGADVVHLINSCGGAMDWDRLLNLAGSHWELLYWSLMLFAYVYPAHTALVPVQVWDEMSRRFAGRVKHPNKDAPFRGSLLDPRMFAIDVDEWGERNLYKEYCACHPWLIQSDLQPGSDQ